MYVFPFSKHQRVASPIFRVKFLTEQEKAGKWQVPIPKVKAMTEDWRAPVWLKKAAILRGNVFQIIHRKTYMFLP